MDDTEFARAFHDVERADDIRIYIGPRIFQTVSHAGLRREMNDDVGLDRTDMFHQPVGFFEAEFLRGEAVRTRRQHAVALDLDPYVVIIGHGIETEYFKTFVQQELAEVKADEAGTARDEYFLHNSILPTLDTAGRRHAGAA